MAEPWVHPLSLPGAKEAWYERYAEWWDERGCCRRCRWHKSSHTDTGYGPDCPMGPPGPAAPDSQGQEKRNG